MPRIYKICLIIAIFIVSGGVALASFNYDSANNYFLFDSVLNLPGGNDNYVLVGNGLIGLPNSLSVSNNLIFLDRNDPGSELKDNANRRVNKSEFSTPAITLISSTNNLVISTPGGSGTLSLKGTKITMNQNFMIPKGLAINLQNQTIPPGTIFVDKVLANNLEPIVTGGKILIPSGTLLRATPTSSAEAIDITFENKPFCEVKMWTPIEVYNSSVLSYTWALPGVVAFCDAGYYVFDMNAAAGKMVCCRYADAQLVIQ